MPTIQEIDAAIARKEKIAQIEALIAQRESEQQQSIGLPQQAANAFKGHMNTQLGTVENLASIGSSMLLEPFAGLAGIATEGAQALGFDTPSGAEAVRAFQGMAYSPRTESGQSQQQAMGKAFGAAGDFITENVTKPLGINDLGGKTLDATGSPFLATVVDIIPELAAELLPAGYAGGKIIKSGRNARRILSDKIKAGNIDAGTIAKKLNANGDLITNPNVKKAIALMGDDDAAYSTAINFEKMNNATRQQVNKMLDVIEQNKLSGDPKEIMKNRPANVIGQSMAKRVDTLDSLKKEASKTIGDIVNGDVGLKKVDVSKPLDDFIKALEDADIEVKWDIESESLVAGLDKTLTNIEEVIKPNKLNNILNLLENGGITAKQAHKLKRNLREMVSYDPSKPGGVKVSREIEDAVKKLSSDMGDSVSKISPDYARANKVMSESIEALQKADKILGNKLMIGDELAESKFGALSKRIGTNLASKEDVFDLLESLDSSLKKRGITPLDDVERQVAALADLEKIFRVESAQAPFGFQSRIAQGAAESLTGTGSFANDTINYALDKFRGMKKGDFESRMKALRTLSKPKAK